MSGLIISHIKYHSKEVNPLPSHDNTEKCKQTSLLKAGFEFMFPVCKSCENTLALNCTVTKALVI
jgi:DNA polymerase III alpha subunit (gram-positive type)